MHNCNAYIQICIQIRYGDKQTCFDKPLEVIELSYQSQQLTNNHWISYRHLSASKMSTKVKDVFDEVHKKNYENVNN